MVKHPLLRGARWRLARPQSRALWTSATARELADLFDDPSLRRGLESFLHLAATTVDGVESLLVFDDAAVDLAVTLGLTPDRARCTWSWSRYASSRRNDPTTSASRSG